jgi:hypothetical protein
MGDEPDRRYFDPDKFTETGKVLAFRLKQNHPDWKILFMDEVAYDRQYYSPTKQEIRRDSFLYRVEIDENNSMLLINNVK